MAENKKPEGKGADDVMTVDKHASTDKSGKSKTGPGGTQQQQ